MPQNYTSFSLCPVDDGALFFEIAANVLCFPHFHPSLIVLAVEPVAHEHHGSAVIDAAFGLPGAFKGAERCPVRFSAPCHEVAVVSS